MSRDSPEVLFLYAYSGGGDAVDGVVSDLIAALAPTTRARAVTMPRVLRRGPGGSLGNRMLRAVGEASYWLWALGAIVRSARTLRSVVSVDVPSGIGFLGTAARVLSRNRVVDISWVMDLYRLGSTSNSVLSAFRARLETAALRRAQTVVTLGECMRDRLQEILHRGVDVLPLWCGPVAAGPQVVHPAPLRLLYSGTAREVHPLSGIVAAVAALPGVVELRIAGRGPEVERARRFVTTTNVPNVEVGPLADEVTQVANYAWADMHVVVLAEEATGTCVPSKAYAAFSSARGVLYLGSAEGQVAREINNHQLGRVVSERDAGAISVLLDALAANGEVASEYGKHAAEYARVHTVHAAAHAWADLLQSPLDIRVPGDGGTYR